MPALSQLSITEEGVARALLRFVRPAEIQTTPDFPPLSDNASHFFSERPPEITPWAYAQRIQKYASTSNEVFLCAMVLLQRLRYRHPRLAINAYNMNRLLITAVMIAAKFSEYGYYSDAYYSRVGGIDSVGELNTLEREMMRLLDNNVNVNLDEMYAYYARHSTRR